MQAVCRVKDTLAPPTPHHPMWEAFLLGMHGVCETAALRPEVRAKTLVPPGAGFLSPRD